MYNQDHYCKYTYLRKATHNYKLKSYTTRASNIIYTLDELLMKLSPSPGSFHLMLPSLEGNALWFSWNASRAN